MAGRPAATEEQRRAQRRRIREALQEGKPIPTELRSEHQALKNEAELQVCTFIDLLTFRPYPT